jgi:hypothetical protein
MFPRYKTRPSKIQGWAPSAFIDWEMRLGAWLRNNLVFDAGGAEFGEQGFWRDA